MFVSEAKAAVNSTDFPIVYRITKQLVGGPRPFDGLVRKVNNSLLNFDRKQLKKWRKHSNVILACTTSSNVLPRIYYIANYHNMGWSTVPPYISEILFNNNNILRRNNSIR